MTNVTKGAARELLQALEPQTLREKLDRDDIVRLDGPQRGLGATGTVVLDDRRRRPRYFDGRFLAARDLTREQNYFLSRQADFGRAVGAGIVQGLELAQGSNARAIKIQAGHGITPAGELVLVADDVEIDLTEFGTIQRLDGAFGLAPIPNPPARSLAGLFIVALRPVEFTANPIASYPTSITGTRSVEDGDIVEATAVTLIPYPDDGARSEYNSRRARAAYEFFVRGATRGLPSQALALGMIALDLGVVRWIDSDLVRREVGAEHRDVLGMGFAPRAIREAHVRQYDGHLQDVLQQRQRAQQGFRFAASEHFLALPPVGRMPTAAIDPRDFTQIYFPPDVSVDLSFVPQDEVRTLIEEAMLLPPVDLTLSGAESESTSVLLMLPVSRQRYAELSAALAAAQRPILRALPPAAPNLVAKRRPLEILRDMRLPRAPIVIAPPAEDAVDALWRGELGKHDLVWFARRRNLNVNPAVIGVAAQTLAITDLSVEEGLRTRLKDLGLATRYKRLRDAASPAAVPVLVHTLTAENVRNSTILTEVALREFEASGDALTQPAALTTAATVNKLGEGLTRLESVAPELATPKNAAAIVNSGIVSELEKIGTAADDAQARTIAEAAVSVARANESATKTAKLDAIRTVAAALDTPTVKTSPLLKRAALDTLGQVADLDAAGAADVTKTFSAPALTTGVTRVQAVNPDLQADDVVTRLVEADVVHDVNKIGTVVDDPIALRTLSETMVKLARSSDPDAATKLADLKTIAAEVNTAAESGAPEARAAAKNLMLTRLRALQ